MTEMAVAAKPTSATLIRSAARRTLGAKPLLRKASGMRPMKRANNKTVNKVNDFLSVLLKVASENLPGAARA
jgi:hypothetical protein